ncbi:MAG: MFS transporter [Deltaproteobacteria bacterium]|nr:MFS transporter [Deltaproteobacteria bacterium]
MDRKEIKDEGESNKNKWMTLITVAMNGFIIILDISIVNISFPKLTQVFKSEPSVVLWVAVVYSLLTVGLMLTVGRIGDLHGKKKVFIIGYILFTVGLILCSLSQSIIQLILSRIVQGVGGAMNMALSFGLVTDAFPGRERGKALGVMSSVFAAGPLLGLTIGGLLLDVFSWRFLFYSRVPICILGIIMALELLSEEKRSESGPKLDLIGAGIIFASLSCLTLFVNMGGRSGFGSFSIVFLGCTSLILFIVFIINEGRTKEPVIDLTIFKNPTFSSATISLTIFGLTQSSIFFLHPYFFISGINYSSSDAGLFLAIPPLCYSLFAPFCGWLSDKLRSKPLCVSGLILQCFGLFLCSLWDIDVSKLEIITGLFIFGLGGSLFFTPNTNLLMGSAPRDRLGSIGALVNTIRQMGLAVGMAVTGMIFTLRQVYYSINLSVNYLDPEFLDRLSLVKAYKDTIFIASLVSLIGVLTSFFIVEKRRYP